MNSEIAVDEKHLRAVPVMAAQCCVQMYVVVYKSDRLHWGVIDANIFAVIRKHGLSKIK